MLINDQERTHNFYFLPTQAFQGKIACKLIRANKQAFNTLMCSWCFGSTRKVKAPRHTIHFAAKCRGCPLPPFKRRADHAVVCPQGLRFFGIADKRYFAAFLHSPTREQLSKPAPTLVTIFAIIGPTPPPLHQETQHLFFFHIYTIKICLLIITVAEDLKNHQTEK